MENINSYLSHHKRDHQNVHNIHPNQEDVSFAHVSEMGFQN